MSKRKHQNIPPTNISESTPAEVKVPTDNLRTKGKRTFRVYAGKCPRHPAHQNTRVYRTAGRIRYCVCDDCGETWKMQGPLATEPVSQPDLATDLPESGLPNRDD
jgi:hypothetical protein